MAGLDPAISRGTVLTMVGFPRYGHRIRYE
jgi:hypothetical protein